MRRALPALLMLLIAQAGSGAVTATDDSGRNIRLEHPAERIVSLSPHITELLFAAGAGKRVVGTVRFSDYPARARDIPRVGDTYNLDMERIIGLQPDLVVLWRSGTPVPVIDSIERTGFPVYHSEPPSLAAIATTIRNLGRLAGTRNPAQQHSRRFLDRLASLRARFQGRKPVRVFYQFWHRPVFTVNGKHLINRVVELCGGDNIFADLDALTPRVDIESVLARDPEVIIASGEGDGRPPWLDDWRDWPRLTAVENNHLYAVPPDLLLRHTPRILDGAELMCGFINRAR